MTTEEFIRSRAAMNWSRRMVADALGVGIQKFGRMLAHMPEVKWCDPRQSVDYLRAKAATRGRCTPGNRSAILKASQAAAASRPQYNIGGFVGGVRQQCAHWGDLVSVSSGQVKRRLNGGVNVFDAFFKPNETPKGWGQNREQFKRDMLNVFRRVYRPVRQPGQRKAVQA